MPLSNQLVSGHRCEVMRRVEARLIMAFAAAVGDASPAYFDTASRYGIVAHPLFPVVLEWPALLALGQSRAFADLTPDERARGVHAGHDLVVHRLIRPDDVLVTTAEVVGLGETKGGAFQMIRFDTQTETGEAVCATWQTVAYRGVSLTGEAALSSAPPGASRPEPVPIADRGAELVSPVFASALAAHVYSECTGIWNPIHTDRACAIAAGLPSTILHGAATLAMAVSEVIRLEANGDPTRVRRVRGKFTGFVPLPAQLNLHRRKAGPSAVAFSLRRDDAREVVADGYLSFVAAPPEAGP